jgi:hypothetical protein
MGYSGGFSLMFPLSAQNSWTLDFTSFLIYPAISGMVVALPQLAKVFFEFADS